MLIEDGAGRIEAQGYTLNVDDTAVGAIASEGFDPVFGDRPLKRHIELVIEMPIGKVLIADAPVAGSVQRTTLSEEGFIEVPATAPPLEAAGRLPALKAPATSFREPLSVAPD